jgi:hypothetical protein
MLTLDSVDPSLKDFFPLIDSIDHRSQNPYQTVDHQSIGSYSTDGIDPSVKNRFPYVPYSFFYMKEKASEYSSIVGRAKYNGLKRLSKDLLQQNC